MYSNVLKPAAFTESEVAHCVLHLLVSIIRSQFGFCFVLISSSRYLSADRVQLFVAVVN